MKRVNTILATGDYILHRQTVQVKGEIRKAILGQVGLYQKGVRENGIQIRYPTSNTSCFTDTYSTKTLNKLLKEGVIRKAEYVQLRDGVPTAYFKNEAQYSGWEMYTLEGTYLGTTWSIVHDHPLLK